MLRLDLAAGVGVPAHVTVMYPFRRWPTCRLPTTPGSARLFAAVPSFTLVGERTAWFGDEVLYVELTGAAAVASLTEAVTAEFPEYPPYGGAFGEVVPHLTVGDDHDASRAAQPPRMPCAPSCPSPRRSPRSSCGAGRHPVSGRGRWRLVRAYPLGLNRRVDEDPSGLRGARRGIRVGVERAAGEAAVEQEGERAGQAARVAAPRHPRPGR